MYPCVAHILWLCKLNLGFPARPSEHMLSMLYVPNILSQSFLPVCPENRQMEISNWASRNLHKNLCVSAEL